MKSPMDELRISLYPLAITLPPLPSSVCVKLYYQQDGSVDMRISDREYSLSTSVRENLESARQILSSGYSYGVIRKNPLHSEANTKAILSALGFEDFNMESVRCSFNEHLPSSYAKVELYKVHDEGEHMKCFLEGDLLDYLTRLIHLKPDARTLGFDFGALVMDPHRIRTVADDLVTLHALKERHEVPATRETVQALHNVLNYVNALSDDGCEVDTDKALMATDQLANMAMILQMNDKRLRVVEDYMKYISLGGR